MSLPVTPLGSFGAPPQSYPPQSSTQKLQNHSVLQMSQPLETTTLLGQGASKTSHVAQACFKRIAQFFATVFVAIPITFAAAVVTGVSLPFIIAYEKLLGNKDVKCWQGSIYSMTLLMNIFKVLSILENKEGTRFNWHNTIVERKDSPPQGRLELGMLPTKGMLGSFHEIKQQGTENGKSLHVIDLTEKKERVTHVLFGSPATEKDWGKGDDGKRITYSNTQAPDLKPVDLEIIDRLVEEMHEKISQGINVYIHCAKGVGRSATIVAAYIAKYGGNDGKVKDSHEAVSYVKQHRQVNLNAQQERQIHVYSALSNTYDNYIKGTPDAWNSIAPLLDLDSTKSIKSLEDSFKKLPAIQDLLKTHPDLTIKDLQVWRQMHRRDT